MSSMGKHRAKDPSMFEKIIFSLKFLLVIFIILPLTFIWDSITSIRNRFIFAINSASIGHTRKVNLLQKQIRTWIDKGRKKKLCNARPAWQSIGYRLSTYKGSMQTIGTDQLIDILKVDTENRTVTVEPCVTIGQLLDALIPMGFTLPLVPTFDDLTVGGLINGCGFGSSGRKYGLFQHICTSYEMLMPDGSVITASHSRKSAQPSENHALFYGVPWSCGSLGFIVSATLKIIPCKPFVKLTYIPCDSVELVSDLVRDEAANRENEFVDAIVFSQERGVVMKGTFDDAPPRNQCPNAIGKWYKPLFYKYVEEIAKTSQTRVEYIPIQQYYRRYSRSIFWGLKYLIPFTGNFIWRCLFGWLIPPKLSLLKLSAALIRPIRRTMDNNFTFQDFMMPGVNLDEALHIIHDQIEVYPLWLCPFSLPSTPGIIRQRTGRNIIYVNIGVYGESMKNDFDAQQSIKNINEFLRAVGGVQAFHGDILMERSEFWEMYDSSLYEWLRVKYGCRNTIPDLYEKTCSSARY